jgi:hypothetical protein
MIPDQLGDIHDSEDRGLNDQRPDDDNQGDETLIDIQEHLEQREAFRQYMMSLPGVEAVRFYRRYGSWTGHVHFKEDAVGAQVMTLFDAERFPNVNFQSKDNKSKWRFTALNPKQGM